MTSAIMEASNKTTSDSELHMSSLTGLSIADGDGTSEVCFISPLLFGITRKANSQHSHETHLEMEGVS